MYGIALIHYTAIAWPRVITFQLCVVVYILCNTICPLAYFRLSNPHTQSETTLWHSPRCHMQSSRQRTHAGSSNTLVHCGQPAPELLRPYLQPAQQHIATESILKRLHIAMSEASITPEQSNIHALRQHAAGLVWKQRG